MCPLKRILLASLVIPGLLHVLEVICLTNQQTKSGCCVRFAIVVIVVGATAVCVIIVVVIITVAVGGGGAPRTATIAACSGTGCTSRPRAGVCVSVGSATATAHVGVRTVCRVAADCIIASVHNEGRSQSVQVATVLGVVNVVLEEHLAHLEERHSGQQGIRTGLMLWSNAT